MRPRLYKRLIRPVQFWIWMRCLHRASAAHYQGPWNTLFTRLVPRYDEDEL